MVLWALVGLEKGKWKAETPVLTRNQSLCQAMDKAKIHTSGSSHSRGERQTIKMMWYLGGGEIQFLDGGVFYGEI